MNMVTSKKQEEMDLQVIWQLGKSSDRDDDWALKKNKVKLVKNVLPEHNCEFIAYDETLIDSIKLFHHGC